MKPQALIITGYGINCEEETAHAFEVTGSKSTIIHINELIENPKQLFNYQIIAFPGGFSYGDDTGSGNAFANKIKNNIAEEIFTFATQDKLIIGICNGFQIITNLGLLPSTEKNYGIRQSALMHNSGNRYECQWIYVRNQSKKCVWTRNMDIMHLPIAHGEGNFFAEKDILKKMLAQDQIALQYVNENGSKANGVFPFNPNGAVLDIAGICDPTGRIFGMMPHPERYNCWTNEENWDLKKEILKRKKNATLKNKIPNEKISKEGAGLQFFKNANLYFK